MCLISPCHTVVPEQVVSTSAHEAVVPCCAGNKQHWQKSMWATLVVAGAAMGSAITFFADAQAAKRHTALLNNMERYQALGGSDQVIWQRIPSSIIACLGSSCAEGECIPLHARGFMM